MMHTLISIISSIPFLVISALSAVLTLFIAWLIHDNFRFTRFVYKRPWAFGNDHCGEFQKLAKDTTDSGIEPDGLIAAERTLCDTFKSAISGSVKAEVSEEQFNRAKGYLKITEQNDIKPSSIWAKIGLFILILAESVGTGYVLAPWMSTEITSSQANVAAAVLALAVAIVLAMLTHHTGAELSMYYRYKRCSGSEGEDKKIDLGDEQMEDAFYIDSNSHVVKKNPAKRCFSNRISDPGSKGIALFVVSSVIIVAIMVSIFEIRLGGIDSEATKQNVSMVKNGVSAGDDGASLFANTTDTSAPPDVVAAQQKSREVVADTLSGDYKKQGVFASIMLSLIYIVTQFTAFMLAFKTAFIGQGEAAYEFTHNEPSFATFYAKYIKSKIDQVESLLSQLRRERAKSGHRVGNATFKSFLEKGAQREKDVRMTSIVREASSIASAKTQEDIDLRWELALKNLDLSTEEQQVLAQKCKQSQEVKMSLGRPASHVSSTSVVTSTVSVTKGDSANYDAAVKSIMDLPKAEHGAAVPVVAEQVSQFGADASAIADLPIDQQSDAIETWLSDNGRKHKTTFMAEVDRLNASKAASSNSSDATMYATAAKSIMSLPDVEREPAMIAWLTDNGAKHEDGMMEAIARFIENQAATPKINSKLSAMLKGQNA